MCGGGGKVDNTQRDYYIAESERARAEEAARQQRIREGMAKIDTNFSQFDDGFYGKRQKAYMDYNVPQLQDKFGDARKELTYALARAGTLNSTVAADRQSQLQGKYQGEQASLIAKALQDGANARANTQATKSALVSQLNATADVDLAANDALAQSKAIYQSQPALSPLGDIFAGIADGIGQLTAARQNAQIGAIANGGGARRAPSRTVTGG